MLCLLSINVLLCLYISDFFTQDCHVRALPTKCLLLLHDLCLESFAPLFVLTDIVDHLMEVLIALMHVPEAMLK